MGISFLLALPGIFKGTGAWLSRRSLGEVAALAIALALLVDHIALLASHRHARKVEAQLSKCDGAKKSLQAQLDAISSKKAEQQIVTREKIKVVETKVHDANAVATKIEQAPPAPNCKTKPEVLNADV